LEAAHHSLTHRGSVERLAPSLISSSGTSHSPSPALKRTILNSEYRRGQALSLQSPKHVETRGIQGHATPMHQVPRPRLPARFTVYGALEHSTHSSTGHLSPCPDLPLSCS
jgi:hypothetical protein